MTPETVTKFGFLLAVQAETEGMKAENKQREIIGQSLAYDANDFFVKANELSELARQ